MNPVVIYLRNVGTKDIIVKMKYLVPRFIELWVTCGKQFISTLPLPLHPFLALFINASF